MQVRKHYTRSMNIVVFGANGRVGRLVVQQLVDQRHTVTAFVHSDPKQKVAGVTYISGDVHDKGNVRDALEGTEVVISALGSWGTKGKDILSSAMQNLIPLMEEMGVRRIVSLTGADAKLPKEPVPLPAKLSRFAFGLIAGKVLRDGEAHLRLLSSSGLDWTVLRSSIMNEKRGMGYTLLETPPAPWSKIHRYAVARAMVEQIEDTKHIRQAPYLHRQDY